MSRRIVKGIRGHHGPAVQVGGEHEGVPLDPVHGGQSLGFPPLLQSAEVVLRQILFRRRICRRLEKIYLRLVELLGEVPVEVHVVGVVPPGSVVVAVPSPGDGVAVGVEGGQEVDLGGVHQPRDPEGGSIFCNRMFLI